MERRVAKTGNEWYGRKVESRALVLKSWTLLEGQKASWYVVRESILPEPSNKPLDGFDGRHQPQTATDQSEKGLQFFVQLLVFLFRHLRAVFMLALVAEKSVAKAREAGIEQT